MIYATVLLCAFILSMLAYRYDMYDREPWYMLLLAIGLGAAVCWVVGYFEDWLIHRLGNVGMTVVARSSIAAITEESCKLSVVLVIAAFFATHFNDPIDGLVYGAFAGIGFGLFESNMYIELAKQVHPEPTHLQLFGQEAIRLLLHFLTGGLAAFGLGLMKFKVVNARVIMIGWLGAALAIHFLWDFACGLPAQQGQPAGLFQRSAAICLMLFATFLFGVAVFVGVSWSRTIHPPDEPQHGLLGWPFSLLVKKQK